MNILSTYPGLWPYIGLFAMFLCPPVLVLLSRGGLWAVRIIGSRGWMAAALTGGVSVWMVGAGLWIFFGWPVELISDPNAPALPGFDVIFKLIGGVALMTGGTAALLIALTFWGIHEIIRANLLPPHRSGTHEGMPT